MKRELVGKIGVDSGSVMIIDPCYLHDPNRWNPKNLLKIATEEEKNGDIAMASNTRRLAKEKTELQNLISNWDNFCIDSENANRKPRAYASGIITPTLYGDGEYSVYVTKDDYGRVKKMEIIF